MITAKNDCRDGRPQVAMQTTFLVVTDVGDRECTALCTLLTSTVYQSIRTSVRPLFVIHLIRACSSNTTFRCWNEEYNVYNCPWQASLVILSWDLTRNVRITFKQQESNVKRQCQMYIVCALFARMTHTMTLTVSCCNTGWHWYSYSAGNTPNKK